MDKSFADYLALLKGITEMLHQLSGTAREKVSAVHADDLARLDACIRTEQALSLSLRSMENKRGALLQSLGLGDVSLAGLAAKCPDALRLEAAQTTRALQDAYAVYRSASEVARTTLEVNLHQIEKILYGEQAAPENPQPPASMKADIRA